MDELGSVIGGKINAKWKVLLTDACHSGAISRKIPKASITRLGDLTQSLFSLTASRDREAVVREPHELDGGHGVFTYYVVKGLEGEADVSDDGIVTADELAEYVHTQVREATNGDAEPDLRPGQFRSRTCCSPTFPPTPTRQPRRRRNSGRWLSR